MTCNEIIKFIEEWAPCEIAWQKDNVGLQVGSKRSEVKNILLCLELTEKVIEDAINKNCNLIITHHPLLFQSLKRIDLDTDNKSSLIEKLIKNEITLYSAHTNLDYTRDGVSFELAKVLRLKNIQFLSPLDLSQYKLTIFVPEDYVEKVAAAVFKSGGGTIGEYSMCSFRTKGEGTFKGSADSNPSIGIKERFEKVTEIKLEIIINSWNIKKVLKALYQNHPYEEPAFDIYPLHNNQTKFGAGAYGQLSESLSQEDFLKYLSQKLKITNFRFSAGKKKVIKIVAVCGGSGSQYIEQAVSVGADAFITADIKYHNFHDAEQRLLLVDAGHYETEIHSMNEVKKKLENYIGKNKGIKVYKLSASTNPVKFFNN
jgi:dinuclear metal center YbgI/SA1388 family protein